MAKRPPARRKRSSKPARRRRAKATATRATRPAQRRAKAPKRAAKTRKAAGTRRPAAAKAAPGSPRRVPRLERERRRLVDTPEIVPTPPSSLNMNRRGSAVRTGRAELRDSLNEHTGMTPALTGGDVDADWENAYFSGDEAPGGDNPTPDQDVVEEIGRSLGVEYQDNEELQGGDKVGKRDKKRWELDPASSEDYKDRD